MGRYNFREQMITIWKDQPELTDQSLLIGVDIIHGLCRH